jgi:methylmalonyl-CoA mutase N-terminal domain/subunit
VIGVNKYRRDEAPIDVLKVDNAAVRASRSTS